MTAWTDQAAAQDMAVQALPNLVETLGEEHPDARRAHEYSQSSATNLSHVRNGGPT